MAQDDRIEEGREAEDFAVRWSGRIFAAMMVFIIVVLLAAFREAVEQRNRDAQADDFHRATQGGWWLQEGDHFLFVIDTRNTTQTWALPSETPEEYRLRRVTETITRTYVEGPQTRVITLEQFRAEGGRLKEDGPR